VFLLVFRGEDDKKAHYPNWARGSKKRVIRHPCSLRARPQVRSYIARLYLSTRTEHEIEQFVLQKCSQNTNFVRFVITPRFLSKASDGAGVEKSKQPSNFSYETGKVRRANVKREL
jgi:hypothetical protein